jgi:polysaccharide export outer membrane protein
MSALAKTVSLIGGVSVLLISTPAVAQYPIVARQVDRDSSVRGDTTARRIDSLRPGDVVRLRIWREPDLSGEFPIDETGVAVFPKIGPLKVTAEPAATFRTRLVAAYSAFLSHTSIDVTFLRRVQVLGAVRQPGVYPVDPTMTISDVLAVAGGTTSDGDPDKLELIRAGRRVPGRVARTSLVGESRVRSGDQIFVPERSWVRRNSGFLVGTAITAAVSIALTLGTR